MLFLGQWKVSARFALVAEPQKQFEVRRCHGNVTLIFQFPIYLEPGVDRYLIYWQLGAKGSKYIGNWKMRVHRCDYMHIHASWCLMLILSVCVAGITCDCLFWFSFGVLSWCKTRKIMVQYFRCLVGRVRYGLPNGDGSLKDGHSWDWDFAGKERKIHQNTDYIIASYFCKGILPKWP